MNAPQRVAGFGVQGKEITAFSGCEELSVAKRGSGGLFVSAAEGSVPAKASVGFIKGPDRGIPRKNKDPVCADQGRDIDALSAAGLSAGRCYGLPQHHRIHNRCLCRRLTGTDTVLLKLRPVLTFRCRETENERNQPQKKQSSLRRQKTEIPHPVSS